jgi:glycerophosphoryl diester phosphodiesterase
MSKIMKKPLVVGHRGAASYEPENTLKSFDKAVSLGVGAIEFDVHLSSDGEVVVIHDETVDRTTNGKGAVKDMSFDRLRKLDAGEGEQIPSLQEVIDLYKDKALMLIELKAEGTAKPVVDILNKSEAWDKVIVISFLHDLVKEVKQLDKRIKTGVLFVGRPINANRLAKDVKADALVMLYKTVDKRIVREAHKEGLKVFIWNIDDKSEVKEYVKLGVDAISSNKPDIVIKNL